MGDSQSVEPGPVTVEAAAERVLGAFLGTTETLAHYVGIRTGWYAALAAGPATTPELAAATGTDARYAQEWLELEAAAGILTVDDVATPADRRRYALPPAFAETPLDETSLGYTGGLPRMAAGIGRQIDALLAAYASGGGVGWSRFGPDAYEAQAALNRPWFTRELHRALSGVPEVDQVLSRPGARLLDVGCGGGWAAIALARAYPGSHVTGVDIDAASIELARRNAAAEHLHEAAGSLQFTCTDVLGWTEPDPVDAAFLLECLHDMPQPVEVLTALRRTVRPDGAVIVMDEAVADHFTAPADEVDRLMYGFSLFVCLPDGRATSPSAATGTVFRRSLLEQYAGEAGFGRVEVLPIADFGLFRFYRLHA